jgi:hypothetical protein
LEEIRDKNKKAISILEGRFKDLSPTEKTMLTLQKSHTSKSSIEANAIKDIRQF